MRFLTSGHHRLLAVVATVLVLAGGGLLGKAALDQRSAPRPPLTAVAPTPEQPSAAPSVSASRSPTASASPTISASPTATPLPRSAATRVQIPEIDVDSVVNETGLDDDGAIAVPQHGPHYDEAAWFAGSPAPGQVGPSVLLGHVDGVDTGPSVFFDLGDIAEGDDVTVTREDGKKVTFTVYRIDRYAKNRFPTSAVYGNTAGPELRVITCGGDIDSGTGHYEDNVVVYAKEKVRA